ncbi:unnamed protein product [Pleuronectes platessa]|uniref:Uncharacterized protein n=1 Tax=Pleuronectes platessa TaxID=8262 RepID=A0A9N7U7N9_PLEPL|nr:unnamed protein product [Pleuronectes platessa]
MPEVLVQSAPLACLHSSVYPDIPLHWTANTVLHFLILLGTVFHRRKPDGIVACQAFHLALVVSLNVLATEGPAGMNHLLLRHGMPLALFQALASPQDFPAGYCSCQWGRK